MGGFLAQPVQHYPSVFSPGGTFDKYPFLLPNLVAAVVIIVAIIQGYFLLEETNPALRARKEDGDSIVNECTPLRQHIQVVSGTTQSEASRRRPSFVAGSMPLADEADFDLAESSFGTIHSIKIHSVTETSQEDEAGIFSESVIPPAKTFDGGVIALIIALILLSYHQMGYASILPVYLLDEPQKLHDFDIWGGLGYTVHDTGIFLAVNGIIAMFIQALAFPIFVEKVGVYRSVVLLTIFFPVAHILTPFLSLLPKSLTPFGIYLILTLQAFFGVIIFPCLLILLKNATPSPLVLGKVNGLAMSACSGARTIAPPVIGIIYSSLGSAAAWWSGALIAGLAILELYWIPREDIESVAIENALAGEPC